MIIYIGSTLNLMHSNNIDVESLIKKGELKEVNEIIYLKIGS